MSHGLCHTHTQSDTITNLNKTDPHKYLMNEPQQDPLELRTTLKFKLEKIKKYSKVWGKYQNIPG